MTEPTTRPTITFGEAMAELEKFRKREKIDRRNPGAETFYQGVRAGWVAALVTFGVMPEAEVPWTT